MKWTKEAVKKVFPYFIIPALGVVIFTINEILFQDFGRYDAAVLIGSMVLFLIIRFCMGLSASASAVIFVFAFPFSNEACAQFGTKYFMGFSVGDSQHSLGFYTHEGKPYLGQTGAPGD